MAAGSLRSPDGIIGRFHRPWQTLQPPMISNVAMEDGIVRAKRNLRGFRAERFGRIVTLDEVVRRDGRLLWRYAACLLAGLAVIVGVHRREKGRPR